MDFRNLPRISRRARRRHGEFIDENFFNKVLAGKYLWISPWDFPRVNPCPLWLMDFKKAVSLLVVSLKLKTMELLYKDLTGKVIDCAITVHNLLGPGLLESAYEECLLFELKSCGLSTVKQIPMPLIYKSRKLDLGYRIDLLVEEKVIIEVKSVDTLNPIHTAQVMTYLKLSGCRIGLLINFNVLFLKEGIKRIIV